jgi:hypothetical protein
MYAAVVGVDAVPGWWLLSRLCDKFVATEGRRKVWVAPFIRDRVLDGETMLSKTGHDSSRKDPLRQKAGVEK